MVIIHIAISCWGNCEAFGKFIFLPPSSFSLVVLLGDSGVGKSSISSRFISDKFSVETEATVGVDFETRFMNIDSKVIRVQLWDTGLYIHAHTSFFSPSLLACTESHSPQFNLPLSLLLLISSWPFPYGTPRIICFTTTLSTSVLQPLLQLFSSSSFLTSPG